MATATYVFEIDWGDDGSFTGNDVVTSDVRHSDVTVDRGRDVRGATVGGLMASELTFVLSNTTAKYHPANSSSPLFGDLGPGRDTRIRTTAPSATGLARGFIEDLTIDPNPEAQSVTVSALGGLAALEGTIISVVPGLGLATGTAIDAVLDEVGWPAGRRAIDTGGTVIPVWFATNIDAVEALRDLLLSEGPGARLFENGDGDIVFHDRHRRLTDTAATTSQATFRDTGTEPNYSIPHFYDQGYDRIINRVEITPRRFVRSSTVAEVYRDDGIFLALSAGQSKTINMQFTNPVAQIVGPDINFYDSAATKHVLIAVSGGAAFGDFDATVDITAYPPTITFDHTGASGTITVLRIRLEGYEYEEADQETLIAEDATSQTLFRTRTLQLSDVWMDENTATDLASAIINDFKDPRAIADITVSNANSTRLTEVLTREVGERVTIIEAGSNLNDTFHVERVRHEISQAGKVHKTTFTCVETIAGLVAANEAFILDDATQGKLGTGKLGY